MANRKQLLDEMAARFNAEECVVLRRDLEVVQRVLLTQRADFEALLADSRFVTYLKRARQISHLKSLDVVSIRRACQQVMEMTAEGRILPPWLAEHADTQARLVLQAFRWVLQVTRDAQERGNIYSWLVSHPVVEAFFPAIPFRLRSEVRIMLVTLQKAYYGFFDGAQMRSLTNLSDEEPPIVFLDEFDFLEHELVGLICRAPQISDPFDFTANFYRAMARHKLPMEEFPHHSDIRNRIKKIVKIIDGVQQRGLDYPGINQFTLQKNPTQGNQPNATPAIFRTQHVISTDPLYINQTTRSFQLEMQYADPRWISATWFFNAIGTATTRILALFKAMEHDEEVRYWEMLRQCFQNTVFFDQIANIAQFPRHQQPPTAPRDSLLDEGYSLFDIDDLQQRTDDEEVEVRFYQMLQTPENLLRTLSQKSLVFGLSATADLPRCVHHFDLDWIENQGLLLPITGDDRADIQQMSAEKAKLRGNRMSATQVDGLDPADLFQERLVHFLEAVAQNDEFGEDLSGHRSQRMHRFFASLLWLLDHGGERPRQLLFLNSFRQVKLLFTTFARHAAEAGLFSVEPLPNTPWFDAFTITLLDRKATVVFFNAELTTRVRQNKEAEQAFARLFWKAQPVLVVTQYLSAGNGVNLQYTNEEHGTRQDFTHIGLLEVPYFFFTKPDPVEMSFEEVFAGQKENIWYQAKLYFAKLISQARFLQVLGTIHHPEQWNQRYQQGSTATDCLFNQLAIFVQALGRVEREWHETPDQVALLSPEVFRAFQAFMGPQFETIREQRASFTSTNLQSLLEAVREASRPGIKQHGGNGSPAPPAPEPSA